MKLVPTRAAIYRALIVPLVMRIIGISDTLSLSLETRAFTLDDSDKLGIQGDNNKSKGFRISLPVLIVHFALAEV